ncbi:hypothetical protein PENTCL1PPCAC_30765 [Pristionchus entomophagus]|uniref:Uncharacterized protein n=1 Tax=Pristionchus entomophagus TaxID=358040 RepID=A0AAV5SL33_9BILA|nr:hypothetical protein PENTCL1PPCAC_6131 [Pristionchus entomophagus]GMT08591.1 hypothetical protein PENTCL1PPCAC_30765 [Pristionchus entomophagus]
MTSSIDWRRGTVQSPGLKSPVGSAAMDETKIYINTNKINDKNECGAVSSFCLQSIIEWEWLCCIGIRIPGPVPSACHKG